MQTEEGLQLREVAMKPETVRLFPHAERGVMIYRGVIEVQEDDAHDVKHMIVGADDVDQPRPASYYQKVLEQRLDKDKGWLMAFRDSDLMPPSSFDGDAEADEEFSDVEKLVQSPGIMAQNLRSRAQLQLEQMRKDLVAQGIDPDEHNVPTELPAQETPPDLENLASYMEEKLELMHEQKAKAADRKKEAEEALRKACEEHELNYDELLDKARRDAGGPPKFRAEQELERLNDQLELGRNAGVPFPEIAKRLEDPDLLDNLRKTEEALLLAYRKFAHHYPPAFALDEEPGAALRKTVTEALAGGESLAGRDLTGAPLAEMDFAGKDLSGAFLEAADLRGCNFAGADLTDCVFARADLTGANLAGASLLRANFGEANLSDCDLSGCDCREAVFAKANLAKTRFDGSKFDSNDMGEARYEHTSFASVDATKLMFFDSDMSNVNMAGAKIEKTMFIESSIAGAAFDNSQMESSVFVKCRGAGATFRNAQLHNFRVVHECDFAGADFHGATMAESNFRGTNLQGSDFSEIQAASADFSECNLRDANFYRAHTPSSMWIRADLSNARMVSVNAMMAVLQKANIEGADFTGANVFRADFARIKGNVGTNFKDANMNQIRFIDRGDHGQR